jgi:D-3-phosphoglycerate dehydrogenase
MEKPTVGLLTQLPQRSFEAELEEHAKVVRGGKLTDEDISDVLREADGVITGGSGRLSAQRLEAANKLRVIVVVGSGTDCVDIEAASRLGIPVISGRGVAPRAIAEYCLGAMVVAHSRLFQLQDLTLTGELRWPERLELTRRTELTGSTLGIIGFGFVGRLLAQLASAAFDVRVLAFDPYISPDAKSGPASMVDLYTVLAESLTVSVHAPLNSETRGLIGARELDLIGPEGVLINVARGGVVDESALLESLRSGGIKGAVVDVFDPEPPQRDRLAEFAALSNVLITPHCAGSTDLAHEAVSKAAVESVLGVLRGEEPTRLVNPEVREMPPSAL